MIKELQYKGYATEPSDYECPDGQLATSLNLINEDEQLKPVFQQSVKLVLDTNCKVVFIHKTNLFEHYIIHNTSTNALYWIDSNVSEVALSSSNQIGSYYAISHLNAVGNTLLVFTATAINYLLWKNGGYNVLGNKLPEITLSFGLMGHPRLYSKVKEDGSSKLRGTFNISFNGIGRGDLYNTFSDENKSKITSQVMAKVNKFIAEQTINKGRFCFPFFVRWAYRLYDGSHMMHSAPVLMTPSTTPAPVVFWKRATGEGSYTNADLDIMMVAADLDYCLTRHGNWYDLDDWQDIISGIDIFISKPIYTYDQNGEFTSFNDDDNMECKFVGRLYNGEKDRNAPDTTLANSITEDRMLAPFSSTDFMDKYMEYPYSHIYAMYFSANRQVPNTTLHMPEFSDDKRDENIESNANFYKLATIDINEQFLEDVGTRKVIEVKDDYLQSLTSREVMTDDYLTHDRLIASSSYGFNSRLNLSGVKRELFDGFISNALFPYCQHVYSFNTNNSNSITISTGVFDSGDMRMRIYIRENGEEYYVENEPGMYVSYLRNFVDMSDWTLTTKISDGTSRVTTYNFSAGTKTVTKYDSGGNVISTETFSNRFKPTAWGSWLFYPNNNAFKIAIYDNNQLSFVADLKAHDFLNGAYAFLGFKSERGNSSTIGTLPTPTGNNYSPIGLGAVVEVPNKIYTSEVNNPFYFPLLGINNVGSGKVLGMSSAAKALSQGQFGQFPLYAFTDEGVWALEVSSNGTYSARQPITRDVCINPDSITQLDSSVLFATDRGIMLISGSQTQCITDNIFSEAPFNVLDLPGIDQLHAKLGHSADACLPMQPFLGFLAGCQMVYDYVHQRIFVYNPTKVNGSPKYTYAYVFSLKSKMWGMVFTNLASTINAYPEALAMTLDNKLVSFSETDEEVCKGLYITRPLKLEAADVHKTISALIQRGHFQRGDVGTVLYGSRDLYTWHLIWSSKDHYLRGFRGTPYKYFRIAGLATLTDGKSIFGASVNFEPRHTNQLR